MKIEKYSGGSQSTYFSSELRKRLLEDAESKGISVYKLLQTIVKEYFQKK